jgi:hypothetical protein
MENSTASPASVNKKQMMLLHYVGLAPISSQARCGRLLVDAWKRTPLRIAAVYRNTSLEFLKMLIDKGSSINRRDTHGQSPLLKSIHGKKEAT